MPTQRRNMQKQRRNSQRRKNSQRGGEGMFGFLGSLFKTEEEKAAEVNKAEAATLDMAYEKNDVTNNSNLQGQGSTYTNNPTKTVNEIKDATKYFKTGGKSKKRRSNKKRSNKKR